MKRLLVSACLLGKPVRYDGRAKPLGSERLSRLLADGLAIAFCPEVGGGLPVPRAPAEIIDGDGKAVIDGRARVETRDGDDVTSYFIAGAELALETCLQHSVSVAVLTESSPSCGSGQIYDGSFVRRAIPGSGVTAALLARHGIAVFNQHQLDEALGQLEPGG